MLSCSDHFKIHLTTYILKYYKNVQPGAMAYVQKRVVCQWPVA